MGHGQDFAEFNAVPAQDGDPVLVAHSRSGQRNGEGVGAIVQLAVGPNPVPMQICRTVAEVKSVALCGGAQWGGGGLGRVAVIMETSAIL